MSTPDMNAINQQATLSWEPDGLNWEEHKGREVPTVVIGGVRITMRFDADGVLQIAGDYDDADDAVVQGDYDTVPTMVTFNGLEVFRCPVSAPAPEPTDA